MLNDFKVLAENAEACFESPHDVERQLDPFTVFPKKPHHDPVWKCVWSLQICALSLRKSRQILSNQLFFDILRKVEGGGNPILRHFLFHFGSVAGQHSQEFIINSVIMWI